MPLTKLVFRPGINREGTNYSNEGGWFDGDKIRFRSGYVERIGGWSRITSDEFFGTCRKLHDFTTLSSQNLLFMGTNEKTYLEDSGALFDITPIRRTVTLGTDALETQSAGSGIVQVTDAGHGAIAGDFVTFSGATAFDGLSTGDLNKEHQVTSVVNSSTYQVDTGGTATSGAVSGGGSSIQAAYQINIGLNNTVLGPGWGAGTWGRFTWGSGAGSLAGQTLRLWFADDYGEDLLFNIADGTIYYWDATGGTATRGVALTSLSGASDVPTIARKVLVSETDRHVLCFGANPIGSADQDPLLIRWSSQESLTDWTPRPTNTAGDLRLSQGSEIITAVRTSRQILVWTDHTLHSIQFLGPPYTFGTALLGDNIRIAGPNTAISVNDVVFWMGQENFYLYDGRIQAIPCTVRDYVFSDINRNQSFKFHAGSLASQNEVWWYYCSAGSNEIDRYVSYNYVTGVWMIGELSRTTGVEGGIFRYPLWLDANGDLYEHEVGYDHDGSMPFAETGPISIGNGDNVAAVTKLIPDEETQGEVQATFKTRFHPNDVEREYGPYNMANPTSVRFQGRQVRMRVTADVLDDWRVGIMRLDMTPRGER